MRHAAAIQRISDRLTARGFDVIAVPGWQLRGRGDLSDITGLVLHHDASNPKATENAGWRLISEGRQNPRLDGPLSQFYLARSGRIYLVAAGLAYHAGKVRSSLYQNKNALGVEAANSGVGEPWPERQLDAYVALAQEVCAEFKLTANRAAGHREVCSPVGRKIDPAGIDLDAFRVRVAAPREVPPPPPDEQTTPFESPEDAMYQVTIDTHKERKLSLICVPAVGSALSLGPAGRCFVRLSSGRAGTVLHRVVLAGPGHFSEPVKADQPLLAGQPFVMEMPAGVVQVEVESTSPGSPVGVLVEPIPASA